MADQARLALDIQTATAQHDYSALTQLFISIAEAELWDIDRLPLYLSCLEEARNVWNGRP